MSPHGSAVRRRFAAAWRRTPREQSSRNNFLLLPQRFNWLQHCGCCARDKVPPIPRPGQLPIARHLPTRHIFRRIKSPPLLCGLASSSGAAANPIRLIPLKRVIMIPSRKNLQQNTALVAPRSLSNPSRRYSRLPVNQHDVVLHPMAPVRAATNPLTRPKHIHGRRADQTDAPWVLIVSHPRRHSCAR